MRKTCPTKDVLKKIADTAWNKENVEERQRLVDIADSQRVRLDKERPKSFDFAF